MGQRRADIETPKITVVIPAMNEARNLEVVLPQLPSVHEVILVDGRSTDDTVAVAKRLLPDVRVVSQTRRGKGNALVCGFAAATGDIVVMFDADGSADPAEIPEFVRALQSGADFAKGSRFMGNGGSEDITRLRSLGNRGLTILGNMLMGTRYTDLCYGYNAFWADILQKLELPHPQLEPRSAATKVFGDGFEIETLLNHQVSTAGLCVVEVPSVERARLFGVSNLNAMSDGLRVVRSILREKRRARAAVETGSMTPVSLVDPAVVDVGVVYSMLRAEENV